MIKIVEDGIEESIYSFARKFSSAYEASKFIETCVKIDDTLQKMGLELDKINITTDEKGEKDCEIIWKCNLKNYLR